MNYKTQLLNGEKQKEMDGNIYQLIRFKNYGVQKVLYYLNY